MLIRCPECGFEREIDPDHIAPSAVRATCPRCKGKFYFRNADGSFIDFSSATASAASQGSSAPGEASAGAVVPADAPEHTTPAASGPYAEDDPLPPGAVVPDVPGMSYPGDEAEKPAQPGESGQTQARQPHTSQAQTSQARPEAERKGAFAARQADRTTARQPASGKPGLLASFEERLREARAAWQRPKAEADDNEPASDAARSALRPPQEQDVPWELPEKYGFLPSLYQTILGVLFGAPRFFAALPKSTTPWIRPVAFYVILGVFQTVMERMWYLMSFQAMGPSITDPKVQELLGAMAHEMSLPMALLLSPVTLFIQLAFYTSLFFLMVRLVHPENASFPLMLRIIAYSAAPAVVCVVPLVGTLVNAVWFAVCCCVGCKYALNMPWSRVMLALGPLYLVAFAVLGQFMRQIMG